MDQGQLDYLREHQQEIAVKLLSHTRTRAGVYGWPKKSLPAGKDPENIVLEVVKDFLEERRHFNPEHEWEIQLKRAVNSKLWALHQRMEANAVSLDAGESDDSLKGYADDGIGPDVEAANNHDMEVLFGMFRDHPKVKGNEELELLLMAVEDGAEKAPDIAAATGISVDRVYEVRKKIKEIYPEVMDKFHQGTEALR
jgi:hypothetical protein